VRPRESVTVSFGVFVPAPSHVQEAVLPVKVTGLLKNMTTSQKDREPTIEKRSFESETKPNKLACHPYKFQRNPPTDKQPPKPTQKTRGPRKPFNACGQG
jgi:hypothetical protein